MWVLSRIVLVVVILTQVIACHPIILEFPNASPGAHYTCGPKGCVPADSDVPADANPRGARRITLPDECAGSFHRIIIEKVRSSQPRLDVACAPIETPIESME